MCNPEPSTLAEYCEQSVSANVLNNAVAMQGMTDAEAEHATPAAKDTLNQSLLDELQTVCTSAQAPTHDGYGGYNYFACAATVEIPAQVQTEIADAPAQSILAEADAITSVDRNKTYGPPRDNHSRTAALWQAYLSGLNGRALDYRDICWMNVLQKASRDVFHRQRDNLRDGAGFLRNIEMADNDEGRA